MVRWLMPFSPQPAEVVLYPAPFVPTEHHELVISNQRVVQFAPTAMGAGQMCIRDRRWSESKDIAIARDYGHAFAPSAQALSLIHI